MKKRIVALILTVVMSLLALVSCGSYDFADEDLSAYVTFDKAAFLKALQEIKIDDGSFTTDDTIRERIVKAEVYNAIANSIVSKSSSSNWIKKGELNTTGDVLYFVYYATDAEGNIFFASNMNESSVSNTATNDNHVVKLGNYIYKDDSSTETDEDFLQLVIDNVNKLNGVKIEDYLFDMYTKAELEAKAEKDLKDNAETTPSATDIANAKKEAIKIKNGDIICIAYDVKYKVTVDGVETEETKKITYEFITVDETNPVHAELIKESNNITVGTKSSATFTVDGKTYSNIEVRWKQDKDFGENGFKPLVSFEYNADSGLTTDKKVTAENNGNSVAINKATLTYHVFPVYAIEAPSFEEITGENILVHVNGKNLTSSTYDEFSVEGYKNGSDTLESLLEKVANIYATTKEGNPLYAENGPLKSYLDKYNELGGSAPSTEQKAENAKAKTALEDAQKKLLDETLVKIAGAKNGSTLLADKIREEHIHNKKHSLKEAYDNEIIDNVQKAVLKLIQDHVKVNDYPAELLEESVDHLYEEYEYKFYTGNFDTTITNYKKYNASFDAYLEATLKVSGKENVRIALEKEAKKALEPVIQIHFIASVLKADAEKALPGYIQKDIDGGAYRINEQEYRDYYKEEADKYIKDAQKEMNEVIESTKEEADMFIIDDAYMRRYKSEIGSAAYRQQIKDYGEINLRTALQVNKIFYYLTCTDIAYNEAEGHAEIEYVNGLVPFRTIKYTLNEKK